MTIATDTANRIKNAEDRFVAICVAEGSTPEAARNAMAAYFKAKLIKVDGCGQMIVKTGAVYDRENVMAHA